MSHGGCRIQCSNWLPACKNHQASTCSESKNCLMGTLLVPRCRSLSQQSILACCLHPTILRKLPSCGRRCRPGDSSSVCDQVSNHGMEASMMDSVMTASREFFHLSLEEKKKCSNLIDGKYFQVEGYGNDQVRTQDQRLDWSDRLHLRVEPEGGRNLVHWPTHPKSFRDDLHEYALKCKRIKGDVLRAMAKILELDEDCLVNQFNSDAPTFARFNHFPPCPRPDLVLGIKPHADFPALTVLLMDKDVAGLQYLRDGTWYNVPAACDHTLLINIGLTMEVTISEPQIMTNGIFTGPMHRVVTNADKERISVAMFYGVDPEQEIGPIAHLLSEEQPAQYRKMKAKDLLVLHHEHYAGGRGPRIADALKI
ncbi:hypothetical protein CFC21_101352 [Triticum aestivum]|uniref:Fe2OG dioxygenase domain-containing protein n=2 Tax=Triticum aestivum TaxID=4565 RepID=A0A3B6SCE2_WHEAT|nr:hypothetical protein CFC21_101352 [Triticum aestivum]